MPVGYGRLEVAVGGRDHAHVNAHVLPSTESRKFAVLEDLQELGLKASSHLADLVEEHRAMMRELELAGLLLDGSGERPALKAKEFGLQKLSRQGCAIDLDERSIAPR